MNLVRASVSLAVISCLVSCGGRTIPAPPVTLEANPTSVDPTGNTTLTWSSTNATACTASGGDWNGTKPTAGNEILPITGTTTFTLTCSGTTPASTTVTVAAGASPFPLRVAPGKRYLVDAQDRPFLITGDAPWSLIARPSNEDAERYLETRRRQGFNAVMVNLIEHKYADDPPNDFYGNKPFFRAGDFSTPNDAYFARAESVIRKARAKGMLVLLAPAYLGYEGQDEGWYRTMAENGVVRLRAYGQYVATRFRNDDNILWVEGGDYDAPNKSLVRAVALGIRDVDVAGKWLHTFHGGRGTAALDFLNTTSDPWLTMNVIYTHKDDVVSKAFGQYTGATLPFFLIEAGYEAHDIDGAGVRAQAYQAVLSGAAGQVMGNFPIWYFGDGWQAALASEAGTTLGYLPALFASTGIAWQDLVPDVKGNVLTSYPGAGVTRAAVSRTTDGSAVLVYTPGSQTLTIDMTKLSGPRVRTRWYDTRTGAFTTVDGSPFPDTGSRSFEAPAGKNGSVLVLQSED